MNDLLVEVIRDKINDRIQAIEKERYEDENEAGVSIGLKEAVEILQKELDENEEEKFNITSLDEIKGKKFLSFEYEKDDKLSASGAQEVYLNFTDGQRILIYVNDWGTVNIERD